MDKGEVFTPMADITAAAKKVAKSTPAPAPAPAPKRKPAPADQDKAKKAGIVHFKAAHGLVVAFFTFILYVPASMG